MDDVLFSLNFRASDSQMELKGEVSSDGFDLTLYTIGNDVCVATWMPDDDDAEMFVDNAKEALSYNEPVSFAATSRIGLSTFMIIAPNKCDTDVLFFMGPQVGKEKGIILSREKFQNLLKAVETFYNLN